MKLLEYRYEDTYEGSECFSIEIQKVHDNDDLNDGDVMPRKRKMPKKYKTSQVSQSFEQATNTSESDSSKKSPVNSEFSNFSNNFPAPSPSPPSESNSERTESDDTMVAIEIEDQKEETSADKEMDNSEETRPRCIRITIKDDLDQVIFSKNMVLDLENIKLKPFMDLIDEFCQKDKGLRKYKKFFKKALYKRFNIPEYTTLVDDNF